MTAASLFDWFAALARPAPATVPATASQRHLLHKRLEHARLAKMLQRMHVSPDTYRQRVHPDVLREQLDTCTACPHTFQCDQALACQSNVDVDLSFCPNRAQIVAECRRGAPAAAVAR